MKKLFKQAYLDRDLSWLKFNKRVAEEGARTDTPIFERLKFMSIYASNMTEFYMVRVGSHYEKLLKAKGKEKEKIQSLLDKIKKSAEENDDYARQVLVDIFSTLEGLGYKMERLDNASVETQKLCRDFLKIHLLPMLSPIILGKNDSFSHIYNDNEYLVTELTRNQKTFFGICKLPKEVTRIFVKKDENSDLLRMFLVEEILLKNADKVFEGMKVKKSAIISLTRNADIDIEEEENTDFRQVLSFLIEMRSKLFPVRIGFKGDFSGDLLNFFIRRTKFVGDHIYESKMPFSFRFVSYLSDFVHLKGVMTSSDWKLYESKHFKPKHLKKYEDVSMIECVKNEDVFFSFPHLSMKPLIKFLDECASSSQVSEIKMTLYRVNNNSKIIDALIHASEKGKKVTVIVELKARFDEKHNIDISRDLQRAGCTVSFGKPNFKVHSKVISVKFNDGSFISYIGTGNFHEATAKLYTDVGVLTANKDVGLDASRFFDEIIKGKKVDYSTIWTTPNNFKRNFIALIDREIEKAKHGRIGSIVIKCNALTHKEIVDKLIEASSYNVKIELIVRGACSIIPKIQGVTDNITVRSIVGKFLEHSRIYSFGVGQSRTIVIASCDLMERNLDRRYEVGLVVQSKEIKAKIVKMLNLYLKDNVNARECDNLAQYHFVKREEGETKFNSQ